MGKGLFNNYVKKLKGPGKRRFSNWDTIKKEIPNNTAGVYTIWRKTEFIYVGMAKKPSKTVKTNEANGLRRRIGKHASGHRGGNMFCVYVGDRFIVPELTDHEIGTLRSGDLKLDGVLGRIRVFIRTNLTFHYITTNNTKTASDLEMSIKRGETTLGKPLLNPA